MTSLALKNTQPVFVDPSIFFAEEDSPFEMANLSITETGIPGFIYISTRQGQHGARIKYYQKLGPEKPSIVVSLHSLTIQHDSLGSSVSADIKKQVIRFVELNQDRLMDFWNEGCYWSFPVMQAFINGLEKV